MNLPPPIGRLLRWSERYTKTDMVYLATGGFWIGLGQIASSLSALLLAVAFANLLPADVYGTYKYALSLASMFAIFTLPGSATALARAVAQGSDGNLRAATRERVLFSLLGVACALVLALYYFLAGNYLHAAVGVIIACALPIFDTFTLYASFLTGKKDFKTQTKYHLIAQATSVLVLLTALFVTDNLLIILCAYFLPLALIRYLFYRNTAARVPANAPIDKNTFVYGRHLSVMNVLATFAGNIDKFLLWHFLGPVQLAVYTFATAIPEQLKGPLKGMSELALPRFAEKSSDEVARALPAFWRKLGIYTLGLFALAAAYVLAAPYIFALLFPLYMDSVPYSQLFALSVPAAANVVPFAALAAQRKTGPQYFLNIVQPLFQTLLFFLMIPYGGIMGAIVAWVAGRWVSFLLTIVVTTLTLRS